LECEGIVLGGEMGVSREGGDRDGDGVGMRSGCGGGGETRVGDGEGGRLLLVPGAMENRTALHVPFILTFITFFTIV
jgi:hypothetical protein